MDEYVNTKPKLEQYYNKIIYNRVLKFYKKDFEYFKKHGFDYYTIKY